MASTHSDPLSVDEGPGGGEEEEQAEGEEEQAGGEERRAAAEWSRGPQVNQRLAQRLTLARRLLKVKSYTKPVKPVKPRGGQGWRFWLRVQQRHFDPVLETGGRLAQLRTSEPPGLHPHTCEYLQSP